MIIVTGGAGFIGSNIVKALNDKGITDILVVDNLKDGTKFVNLVDLDIADYMDKEDFLIQIMAGEEFGDVEAIFHEGACSSTTEWDGKYMMDNNYQYSKELLHYCLEREIPFLYASSAATYGGRTSDFIESREYENHLTSTVIRSSCLMNMFAKSCRKPTRRLLASAISTFMDRVKAIKAAWRASLSISTLSLTTVNRRSCSKVARTSNATSFT